MDAKEFMTMVHGATPLDDDVASRLLGVLCERRDGRCYAVATDGHRMAVASAPKVKGFKPGRFDKGGSSLSERWGPYAPWWQGCRDGLWLNRDEAVATMRLNEEQVTQHIAQVAGHLVTHRYWTEQEEIAIPYQIPCEVDFGNGNIAYLNAAYLIDALVNYGDIMPVELWFYGRLKAVTVVREYADDVDLKHVVMPLKEVDEYLKWDGGIHTAHDGEITHKVNG